MAGLVTALRFQKHAADRVNVYLDERFALGLPAVEAAKLRVGQYLSDADVARLRAVDAEQQAYDRAVRLLGYRPRSQVEIRQRLAAAEVEPAMIEAVVQRLADEGYLNDEDFARFWVENRERFRPRSPQALRQELRRKGVADDAISAAVADLDPVASACEAGRPRARRLAALPDRDPVTFRRQLAEFLLRRGFDHDAVRAAVLRLQAEVGDALTD